MTSSLTPDQIEKYGSRLLGKNLWPGLSRRWQQNRAIRKLQQDGSPAAVRALALPAVSRRLDDEDIWVNLTTALKSMGEDRQLKDIAEFAIQFSSEKRSAQLFSLIKQADYLPLEPPDLRVAVALACGWPERLADDGPEVVPAVLEACAITSSREAAISAILALRTPAAIDTLCRYWMETGTAGDNLATLLVSAGHSPSELAERSLFWLLIGQIQRYEELDLDGSLLVQGQAAASTNVRKRFAAAALAGRMEWLGAMQQSKPLDQFNTDDWATTVELLKRAGGPNAIWSWALKAPPTYAKELLKVLPACTLEAPQTKETTSRLQRLAGQLSAVPDYHNLLPNFCTHTLSGHSDSVNSIAWSPDGRCLASGSRDGTIRLWDPASGVCTHTLTCHSSGVSSIAWSPDGRCLASCSQDKTVRLWDPATGACTHTLSGHSYWVNRIAWSPDGRCLGSIGYDQTIRLWDPATGACTHIITGHSGSVNSIAWSPDGRCLASYGYLDNIIRLWDPASGVCIHTLSDHFGSVKSIAWSSDGRCLASGSHDHAIRLWDPATGACTHTITGHSGSVISIAWSPDGRCLASCSCDSTIRLWDPATGDCTRTLSDHRCLVRSIAWSPDGRCLASGSDDSTIRLWDLTRGTCTRILSSHSLEVSSMSWSPDGRCLASGSEDDTIRLWVDGFIPLLTMPLACYGEKQWRLLTALVGQSSELEDWQLP
jgi:WD40 repeat protein